MDPVLAFVQAQGRRRFGLPELIDATGHTRKQCLRAADKLAAEGYLAELADAPIKPDPHQGGPALRNPIWQAVEGKPVAARSHLAARADCTHRARMWRLIRMRRQFTVSDLVVLGGVTEGTARLYAQILERHKIVRRIGKRGRELLWILRADTVARPRLAEDGPPAVTS